jgi:homoserine O-succinyltransferase
MKNTKINIGIINIMPKTATYHDELLTALRQVATQAEFYWIRLQSKSYADEDLLFMNGRYQGYAELTAEINLDALIVTGAPVELLDFAAVNYWPELKHILQQAMSSNICTLGICWGALAIGQLLDLGKVELAQKVFGVFQVQSPIAAGTESQTLHRPQMMPFSIQATFCPEDLAQQLASAKVKCLGLHPDLGGALLCSSDHRHVMCLGHPEYGPYRLLDEWRRDVARMPNLQPPSGLDIDAPEATWRDEADQMFRAWFAVVQRLSVQPAAALAIPHVSTEPSRAIPTLQEMR